MAIEGLVSLIRQADRSCDWYVRIYQLVGVYRVGRKIYDAKIVILGRNIKYIFASY